MNEMEVNEMQGRIENIEPRISSNKQKQFWLITIDNEDYSCWDETLIPKMELGAVVEFDWKQSKTGNFKNIVSVERLETQEKVKKTLEQRIADLESRTDDLEDEIEELKKGNE
jgi:hypothetical protein